MKIILLFCFGLIAMNASAQHQQKTLNVGDSLYILPCHSNKEYNHIDIYTRTNDYDHAKVNVNSGEGLYQAFFQSKNLEGKRLPCMMGGKKYKIAALEIFGEGKEEQRVVFLYDYYYLNLIWVQIDDAIKNHEVEIR